MNPIAAWRRAALAALAALFAAGLAAAQTPHTHQHDFRDAQHWSRVFDDPQRDVWQKPHEVIQALKLKHDAVIADIGAGTGYFAMRLARMTPDARVYAVDTEPDMIRYLVDRARRERLTNVIPVLAAAGDPRLPEKADWIILVDVYHHIEDRTRYFAKLKDALRPGGRIAIIDFRRDSPVGPPVRARIAPDRVKAEVERAGYVLSHTHDFLPNQYFLIFEPGR